MDDRPIVFTVSKDHTYYTIKTRDARAKDFNNTLQYYSDLIDPMREISSEYNNRGYAVLFEVD